MATPVPPEYLFWGTLTAVGIAYEWQGVLHNPDQTLSDVVRDLFHVKSRPGRIAFGLAWGAFALWFMVHILS